MRVRPVALGVAFLAALVVGQPSAAGPPVGAGSVAGTWVYENAPPPVGEPCKRSITSVIDATSLTASIGVLTVTGTANSGISCEAALLGGGHVVLSADFIARDGTTYDCPNASGTYTRSANEVALIATAPCTVNAYGTALVTLTMTATFVPETPFGWFVGTFTFSSSSS